MTSLQLPPSFQQSYENFDAYPCNLVHKTSYGGALKGYRKRLDDAASKLCTSNENLVEVPFRDVEISDVVGQTQQLVLKRNIFSDAKLRAWIGDTLTMDPLASTRIGALATKRDPKCRFIYLLGDNSRTFLNITQSMLVRILSYHQVMPSFLDLLLVFGSQSKPRDLRYSAFHEQTFLNDPPRAPEIASLGRSGRQLQLSYNLKAIARIPAADPDTKQQQWSIRQGAFHHQFDVVYGTTLWIVTKGKLDKREIEEGRLDIKERVEAVTGRDGASEDKSFETPEKCFRSSLAIHLLYGQWSVEEWRWYVQWLEQSVNDETDDAVKGPRTQCQARRQFLPEDIQTVQIYEEYANEAIMILEANVEVLSSLRNFYERLLENNNFPLRHQCSEDVFSFATQLNSMIHDTKMHISRAKLLVRLVADRKVLILQHLQTQTTETMEHLTESMHKIAVLSQRETIAMRIITVVTLIYLPATFVSTFFSTDVIKYQNGDFNGTFSAVALFRWLEVTLPLTMLTFAVAWFWFRRIRNEGKASSPDWYTYDGPEPKVQS